MRLGNWTCLNLHYLKISYLYLLDVSADDYSHVLTDFVGHSVVEGIDRMWVNHPPKLE